jgi:hypothetical protein
MSEENEEKKLPEWWRRELSIQHNPDKRIQAAMIIPAANVRRPKNTKLTPEAVMYIRYGDWKSLGQLSHELGVSLRCIWEVANYYTWRDMP